MKTLHINDEVYENLKAFVVDPFDDTPNTVLLRLIDIANKAQSRWCAFTSCQQTDAAPQVEEPRRCSTVPAGTRIHDSVSDSEALML